MSCKIWDLQKSIEKSNLIMDRYSVRHIWS
jgi:hypothetical protein